MKSGSAQSVGLPNRSEQTVSGWELGQGWRRALLAVHIALACVWIGALAVILVLVGAQQLHPVVAWRPGLDRAVLLTHDVLILHASYGFVLTGLVFSLFTRWGAFRFWWVALKWALWGALGLALPLWVSPHVNAMTALSDALSGQMAGNAAYAAQVDAVLFATALQLAVLSGMVVLSVVKPWGPRATRRRWPRAIPLTIAAVTVLAVAANLWLQDVLLEGYRKLPAATVDVSALRDGLYEGQDTATGFVFRVRVQVADGRIAGVEVLANGSNHYAQLATLTADKLEGRANNDVDALSGATTTSQALLRAVADALQTAPRRATTP